MENEQSLQARKEAIEDEKKTLITQLEELAVEIDEYDVCNESFLFIYLVRNLFSFSEFSANSLYFLSSLVY